MERDPTIYRRQAVDKNNGAITDRFNLKASCEITSLQLPYGGSRARWMPMIDYLYEKAIIYM